MKVKMLRDTYIPSKTGSECLYKDKEVTVGDDIGKKLIAYGYAKEVDPRARQDQRGE